MSLTTNVVSPSAEDKDQRLKSIPPVRKSACKICSTVFIPGMIGLLTIAIAILQLHIASQQRQQDLAIADANRLNSLTIANHTRDQDLHIANILRWDAVFAAYVNDISTIISTSNFSFVGIDPLMGSVIRAKTLTACRQLDVVRKAYLIQFLYELKAITSNRNPIDLSGLELNNIALSGSLFSNKQRSSYEGISLTKVSLINASSVAQYLVGANFAGSILEGAHFQQSVLHNVSFHGADLENVNFANAFVSNTDYSDSDLRGSNITDIQLQMAYSILFATLPNNTMGSNPMLILNGNAEQETNCSTKHVKSIRYGGWSTIPQDSIGAAMINHSVAEDVAFSSLIMVVLRPRLSVDSLNRLRNHFWKMERCSFAMDGHQNQASLSQFIRVPERYRNDAAVTPYSWFLKIFCGSLKNNVIVSVNLIELDKENRTLNIYQFIVLPDHGILMKNSPYNKNATHLLFKLDFLDVESDTNNSTTFDESDPVAFCDNIHLSLELSSVAASIPSL